MCCAWLAGNAWHKKSPKIRHLGTIAQFYLAISSQLKHVSTIGKSLLNSNVSPTCAHNMVNFGPLAAEIFSRVWGTPANFNRFRVLAALLHGTLVVGVSQTLRHWTRAPPMFGRATITLDIGPHSSILSILWWTGMWADAQRDGRPAKYKWHPLRKFRNSIPCTTPQSLADACCWSAVQ